ncbi:MAG: hypothetical protein M1457_05320 [bacterium]|nr:hypothetical protein [bacterium]
MVHLFRLTIPIAAPYTPDYSFGCGSSGLSCTWQSGGMRALDVFDLIFSGVSVMRKFVVLALAVFCVAQLSHAATITVSQAGGADQTTIAGALAAANSGDVIEIEDGATYSEALPVPFNTGNGGTILNILTLQVAAGQTPTIENTAGAFIFGPVDASTTVTGPFVIKGDSNTSRLTLKSAGGSVIGSGPNNASKQNITVMNVNCVRTGGGVWLNLLNDGVHIVSNVTTAGGDPNGAGAPLRYGGPNYTGSCTVTNLDTLGALQNDGSQKVFFYGGTMVVNNSNIVSAGGAETSECVGTNNNATGSITVNDSTIAPGVATGVLTRRIVSSMGPCTMTFNRCNFGPTAEVPFRIMNGGKLVIAGTPTTKCSLDSMIDTTITPTATLIPFSVEGTVGGDLTLTDVSITKPAGIQTFRNIPTIGRSTTVTMDRCFMKNLAVGNGAFTQSNGGTCFFNLTNTIWMGAKPGTTAAVFGILGAGGTNSCIINLNFCSFVGDTTLVSPGALYWFHNHSAKNNFITANYCIFDDRSMGGGNASFTHSSLSGNISLVSRGSFLPNQGPSAAIPADWIVGTTAEPVDPKLAADGRLTDLTSPAIGAAVGSSSQGMIDIDGNPRPLNNKDLGASQTPFPNAASGWTEFK